MIPSHLDFRQLRRTVSIEQVLRAKGLDSALKKHGSKLVGPCPLHGGDNPHAFVVDPERNLWYCFTRCSTGGDVVKLLCRLGHSYAGAAAYLANLSPSLPSLPSLPPTRPASTSSAFQPYCRSLPLNPYAPFFRHKGILPSTARHFEAGSYHGSGFLAGCIGVRLHGTHGRPLGYAGRRLDPSQVERFGKWKLPPALPKNDLLYNFHRIAKPVPSRLVIVECPWGVMRLAQLGIPAVALLGTSLSDQNCGRLVTLPHLTLMLDGDPAGECASVHIERILAPHTRVTVVRLPPGLDPDHLSDQQLSIALSTPNHERVRDPIAPSEIAAPHPAT